MRCAKSPRLLLLCIPLARDLVLGAYVHNVIYFYTGRRNVRRNCRRKFRRARFSPRREKKAPSQSPGREREEREREEKRAENYRSRERQRLLFSFAQNRPPPRRRPCELLYLRVCVYVYIGVSTYIYILRVCSLRERYI